MVFFQLIELVVLVASQVYCRLAFISIIGSWKYKQTCAHIIQQHTPKSNLRYKERNTVEHVYGGLVGDYPVYLVCDLAVGWLVRLFQKFQSWKYKNTHGHHPAHTHIHKGTYETRHNAQ